VFFASNRPFNAPLAGLFAQYIVSCTFMLAPPPGDAYLFMISLSSYALAVINTLVSLGLLLLYTKPYLEWHWDPPFRAPKIIVWLYLISNIFLVVVPLIPPSPGSGAYEHLPYCLHVFMVYFISLTGVAYWYASCIWLPKKQGYRLERDWILQADDVSRYVFRRTPLPVSS